ncbi:MAG: insulinase family protein, partial [Dehalococcoidia bacterium]|nr:insulinase family protein [Dehalococcoidia bacterium]
MANEPEITMLPNGLRLVTTAIPSAQSASVSFFVRVGSRDERGRTNGLSHYIEHMLFKGTERRPTAAVISETIEGAGGALNAFTGKEMTCYWNNLPYERVETGIEVLADMLQHSLLAPEEIERERTVVQQEIRRAHDSPGSYVGELLS